MKDKENIIMEKCIYDEKNGLSYTLSEDGYYYPDLALLEQEYEIGRFGRKHADYLKEHKYVTYMQLLNSGKLNEYLHKIDTQAKDMFERLIKKYAKMQGVTEQLKADKYMEWVGRMNNIRNAVKEIIYSELIYQ